MNEERRYVKLGDLVDSSFTVEKVYGYKWKMWDANAKRMLVSDTYEKDYRKVYGMVTDQGTMDLGSGQIGSLLEVVMKDGVADLNGKSFNVKSNGKSGMDIRYYFSPAKSAAPVQRDHVIEDISDEPIDLSEIPF